MDRRDFLTLSGALMAGVAGHTINAQEVEKSTGSKSGFHVWLVPKGTEILYEKCSPYKMRWDEIFIVPSDKGPAALIRSRPVKEVITLLRENDLGFFEKLSDAEGRATDEALKRRCCAYLWSSGQPIHNTGQQAIFS